MTHLAHDWFPAPLPENVRLGPRSWLYSSYAFIHCRSRREWAVTVGADSGLYAGTFFDLGPDGEVVIGRCCSLVGAIVATNGRVEVHDYAFIAHEVVIADGFAQTPVLKSTAGARAKDATPIVIGENAWIGARAVLLHGARIGRDAIVGAGAVVDMEVPPGSTVAGNPARVVCRGGPAGAAHDGSES